MREGIHRKPSHAVVPACAKALWQEGWKGGQSGWRAESKIAWKGVRLERWPFFKSQFSYLWVRVGR